ncbi:hypothetical protein L1987_84793 [Smallanthus sonchifolius]|uniref:Uncharacterized protein n=1 Tax=Smallanthus sonchifolius TaxID=185202 RepID=A0ACB8XUN9_9ASTR|nr:hypothetical protein L1987_84793 [Smallanthus sonchifolius]
MDRVLLSFERSWFLAMTVTLLIDCWRYHSLLQYEVRNGCREWRMKSLRQQNINTAVPGNTINIKTANSRRQRRGFTQKVIRDEGERKLRDFCNS